MRKSPPVYETSADHFDDLFVGPPPAITFPPALSISVSISGTLPEWPKFTIGPDRLPTFQSEPEDCKTESAEICLTHTSISSTITSVTSTCATVYGCDVEDSASSSTTIASCSGSSACPTCYSWPYDAGIDWGAVGNGDPDGDTAQPAARSK